MPTPTPVRRKYYPPQIGKQFDAQTARNELAKIADALLPMVTRTLMTDGILAGTDDTVLCDTTALGFTLTIPIASVLMWLKVTIKNVGSNTLTLPGDPIDGMSGRTLAPLEWLTIQSDGVAWWIIGSS